MEKIFLFLRRQDVTFTESVLLSYIAKHEGCAIINIAHKLALSRTAIHDHLHKMRQKKLIITQLSETDKRHCNVFLSPEGFVFIKQLNKKLRRIGDSDLL